MFVALLLIQPLFVNAAPIVRSGETTAQRGLAELRFVLPKTAESKAAEATKPVVEKAIGIDEWMAQNNPVPAHSKREVEPIIAKPLPLELSHQFACIHICSVNQE